MAGKSININEIKLDELFRLDKKFHYILSTLLIIAILFFGYLMFYSSQLDEINALENKEIDLKQELEKKANMAAALPVLKEELAQIERDYAILLKLLPTDAEVPELIQELNQAASNNSLKLTTLVPEKVVVDNQVKILPYQVTTTGSYNQIKNFAASVGRLNRIVVIDSIDISPSNKDPNVLNFKTKVNTYQSSDNELFVDETTNTDAVK